MRPRLRAMCRFRPIWCEYHIKGDRRGTWLVLEGTSSNAALLEASALKLLREMRGQSNAMTLGPHFANP